MKKEDYQSHSQGIPIDLVFIPEAIQIDFKQKIKLQIAFYRSSKVCKSSPAKFLKSDCINNRIALQPERLQFCTTILYDSETRSFESKTINVQLAYQSDAGKETIDSKIDLKDVLLYQPNFERTGLVALMRDDIKVYFGVVGKCAGVKGEGAGLSPHKSGRERDREKEQGEIVQYKSEKKNEGRQKQKMVVFKEDQKQNDNISAKNNLQNMASPRSEKSFRQKLLEIQFQSCTKKLKTLEQKLRQSSKKYQQVTQQLSMMKTRLKQSQSSADQKTKQIQELQKLNSRLKEQKNSLLANMGKNASNEQGEMNRKLQMIDKLNQEITHLKEINGEYKGKIEEFRRNQGDLRGKYQESERKIVALTSDLAEANYVNEKLQKEQEKYVKKIEKLEKELSESTSADVPRSEHPQKGQEVQKLSKLLQTKQQIIRMLKKETQMKKSEQNQDITLLKKQNKELKQQIQKLKDTKKQSQTLQLKIHNEKLKKQCAQAKREQKKMLTQKLEIETKSKEMALEMVRLKQTIGEILNIVQEKGTSDLFTLVADCVS